MSVDKITLKNRYREKYTLLKQYDGRYKLDGDLEYLRVIYDNDGSIHAIDPPGGPFIHIGSELHKMRVSKIDFDKTIGFLITIE